MFWGGVSAGGWCMVLCVVVGREPLMDLGELVGLLVEGRDVYRAREAVAYARRGRRVSWWVHRAELEVLRARADGGWVSMGSVVRVWWEDGLPLLADPGVVLDCPGGWRRYAHCLPLYSDRPRGTPRSEWTKRELPDGVLDLEAGSSVG